MELKISNSSLCTTIYPADSTVQAAMLAGDLSLSSSMEAAVFSLSNNKELEGRPLFERAILPALDLSKPVFSGY